ncbi:hypothetical protein ASZ90_011422 [hydrocarbon metagenome]|uniref:Uncharacterized protein n=1 Tax=hydrocarbon metagenome TaxID=938273 RepID=A0A0W8FDA9_9ZZZZ|nr:hypothetical protein [Methanomicrobiaceae archaeon]
MSERFLASEDERLTGLREACGAAEREREMVQMLRRAGYAVRR